MDQLRLTGVSHFELHVSDLDASTQWYLTAVGLVHLRTQPGRFSILQPGAGGFRLALTPGRPADAHGEIGHIALAVDSLESLQAWAAHLDQIGVDHPAIKENSTGHSLDLVDPDGHEIELTFEP
jgi:catechol-2,3-dioxygenase